MNGPAMMLKAMLGIDPEEIREQAEAFLQQIAAGLQTLQARQLDIDAALIRIEQRQEMCIALMQSVMLGMSDRTPQHFVVPRALEMQAFDAEEVFPKQQQVQ